ncbi:MAG: hypothetical protein KDB27_30240, partial [Planctomycetales bacterium]|nr:hypothetical protein [Planctomycetales bacterium]
LYFQSRQREWALRREQAQHRLNIAYELISREVQRVRSDSTYLASRDELRRFVSGDESVRNKLENDFMLFVQQKELYDQLRVLNLDGREILRVNFPDGKAAAVSADKLQDKSGRYYFQEARTLLPSEIFVSEFDLNEEHGTIERPFKPVIRFLTPVTDEDQQVRAFVALNFLGKDLLSDLDDTSLGGYLLLLRPDGHYIRGADQDDAWGWLLGHDRTFAAQFAKEWHALDHTSECRLSAAGAFASTLIPLGRVGGNGHRRWQPVSKESLVSNTDDTQDSITAVSYLPRESVFAASNELLHRLLIFGCGVIGLAVVFTRAWAKATWSRQLQSHRIATSEERLRELSSRLLRIQEEERRAISREIHDEFGQQATAINLDLKLAQRNIGSDKAAPHLQRAIDENETLLRTLHEFAKRVRPAILDDLGLKKAIESQLSDFEQRTMVQVHSSIVLPDTGIPDEIADNAFRLIQESLNNVAKHAGATKVDVELSVSNRSQRELRIAVRDDGRGHGEPTGQKRLGLVGMRERVDLLGGTMTIQSEQDQGSAVEISIPIECDELGDVS